MRREDPTWMWVSCWVLSRTEREKRRQWAPQTRLPHHDYYKPTKPLLLELSGTPKYSLTELKKTAGAEVFSHHASTSVCENILCLLPLRVIHETLMWKVPASPGRRDENGGQEGCWVPPACARLSSFAHRSSLQFFSLFWPPSLKSPMSDTTYSILSLCFSLASLWL